MILIKTIFGSSHKYAMMHVPSFRRNFIGNMLAPPCLGAITSLALGFPFIFTATITLILFPVTALLMLAVMRRQIKKVFGGSSGFLGEHTIIINREGLQEETAVNISSFSWPGVMEITENNDFIFVFIANHMAHVIPKRAFGLTEEARAFFEQAETFRREALQA